MQYKNRKSFFSPTDLTLFTQSPFASWMNRFTSEFPDKTPESDADDELMNVLQAKGFQHEKTQLENFESQGLAIIKIDAKTKDLKKLQTLQAIQDGVDVIVQAYLEDDYFYGYADFLVKVSGHSKFGDYHYEVWDTKLSSKAKPEFIIQLCCYTQMLEATQEKRPEHITLLLGNGEQDKYKVDDYFYYYTSIKNAFLTFQETFDANNMPDPADSKSWGCWSTYAEKILIEKDHLFQVANITRSQIKKLNKADIKTTQQLVDSSLTHVSGINLTILTRLKEQAAIQIASKGKEKPCYKIIAPAPDEKSGLALLPPHSPLDVFFDIEGYPLENGGLEYLWGSTYFDEKMNRCFKDFWAHNEEQEKLAFKQFIEWVYERWQRDPEMHIYHYANYEIAACRKLMGRYGVCEYELDQLLRNEVFIDLYKIVKGSLLLGEPKYAIKNVEHLYRGKRETEVGTGGDSVVVYERWRDLFANAQESDYWEESPILKSIRDYNIDDCNSTQELVMWLRDQQQEKNIAYLGKTEVEEPELKEEVTQVIMLRDKLLEKSKNASLNPKQKILTENLAWTLEFHRRELKPMYWRLFDRLGASEEELFDDLDCLAFCKRTGREPFKLKPRDKNLVYEYCFDTTQEFKGKAESFYVLGSTDNDGKNLTATLCAEESDLENGLIALKSKNEPPTLITLVPDERINPKPIPNAIYKTVEEFASGHIHNRAILDFLNRTKPRIKNHSSEAIAPSHDSHEKLQQVIHAIKNLDNSYLTIQGPPGAGKSYTAKHVIAELIKNGAKIGISSNSHKAINHLLVETVKYCKEKNIPGVFVCTKNNDSNLIKNGIQITENAKLLDYVSPGCVLGTTAWGFARPDMEDQLDYLFVDEAGQVSVANLIGMSRSAKNLILMGDQMQLGQPSQGSHPGDSGLSALDYLLHETPTIPDDMGVFLDTTYRMHSSVNQFISKFIYEGKLESHPNNDKRIVIVPHGYCGELNKEAGIIFIPVNHDGNTYGSDEEVDKIQSLVADLLSRIFIGDQGKEHPITLDDILFVTPYNYQVKKLKQAFGAQAKVGSVDKFQGQEAPIVILSMCTSDPSESPRGIDFLFDKHRLNVAISRAQSLAIVVANPAIGMTLTGNIGQMSKLNIFNAIITV